MPRLRSLERKPRIVAIAMRNRLQTRAVSTLKCRQTMDMSARVPPDNKAQVRAVPPDR